MTGVRPRTYVRPVLLVALVALLASLLPASPAFAQTDWDRDNACPTTVPRSGFTDATGTHGRNIDCLAWYALTSGRTPTTYGTQNNVRRDQTATFVVRVLERMVPNGFDLPPREVGAFRDVDSGPHRANIEVLAGFDPAIVAGYTDGTYRPLNALTRAQFASIIARALDHMADQGLIDRLPAASSTFSDTRGSVHEANIARLARAGIVQGKSSDRYDPQGSITRGQTASILARVLGGLVDEELLYHPRDFSGVIHDGTDTQPGEIGTPIANARITASGFTEVGDRSDSAGRYSIRLQQPSTYTIELTADGFAPQQRGVILPNPDAETDFAMYRQTTAPPPGLSTGSDANDVTISGDDAFWVIDVVDTLGEPFGETAEEVRLEYPGGLVIELGTGTKNEAWFSRDPGLGTSERIGADSGTHTLYYLISDTWYDLQATFDTNGTLVKVNGNDYLDPDAS